jgi:hypothetical protein
MTDDNGKSNTGVTVQYILNENITPFAESEKVRGYKVAKASLPQSADADLTKIPGVYECDFTLKPNAMGKPELKLISVKHKPEIKIS